MRTLLVGLDGFDASLARRWMGEGRLPCLAAVAGGEGPATLRSLVPSLSPAVWTSLLTGLNPARHGVFDFTERRGRGVRLVTRFRREALGLFELLSLAGRGVLAVGFPASRPLARVRGVVVAGWDSLFQASGGRSGCTPAWVHDALSGRFGRAYLPFDEVDQLRLGAERLDGRAARALRESPGRRAELCLWMLRSGLAGAVDCLAVYFPEADAAGHHFWHFHDPRSPRAPALPPARDPLRDVYEALDEAVGRLADGFRPDAVVALSDHGMGGSGTNAVSLNRFLADSGRLRMAPAGGAAPRLASLAGRAALGALAAAGPRARERLLGGPARALSDRVLGLVRFGGIDMERSQAFSEDLNYAPSIWLAGEPGGREREALVRRLVEELRAYHPVLAGAAGLHPGRELYRGPFADRIPDVIVDLGLDEGYSYNLVPGHFRQMRAFVEPLPPRLLTGEKGKSRPGSHRPEGVLIAGGALPAGWEEAARRAGVYDVAPLVLRLHGLRLPGRFDSDLDLGGETPEALRRLPAPRGGDDGRGGCDEYARTKTRLEGLGYL